MTVVNHSTSQELKLDLKPNETYFQNNVTEVKIETEFQGEKVESYITFGGRMSFKVNEKTDSIYNLEVKYQNLHYLVNTNNNEISANTKKVDSTNMLSLILKEMIKSPFEMSITKYGEVRSINMESFFNNLFNWLEDVPKLEKARLIYMLKQSFGEKAMKGAMETLTAIYPKKPVEEGDIWENEIRVENLYTMILNNKFELLDRNENFMIIKEVSKTRSKEDMPYVKQNGELMRVKTHGEMLSTYKIDSKTGWIIEAELVQNIKGLTEKKWKEDSIIIIETPFKYDGVIKLTPN